MKIVIAGASGMVGNALAPALRAAGHEVLRLVRRQARGSDEILWNPATGEIDVRRLGGLDAAINLAGENVGAKRWTDEQRERILRSRVEATQTLVKALKSLPQKPAVLVNASAVGFYGDRGGERLTEASPIGRGFLPEVCLAWETHAEGAARAGIRTVMTRFGTVLDKEGGALAKLLPLFRLGLGGRMGPGTQWMSWISLEDAVAAIQHALASEALSGPVNVVAPQAVTNANFAATLGRVVHRPAFLPVPSWALHIAAGRGIADEALLASTHAVPERLLQGGFRFKHAQLEDALRAALR
ncbi:MAG: TIGR01777 family oxidoreductase [Verrucomicrobiota bacterium]